MQANITPPKGCVAVFNQIRNYMIEHQLQPGDLLPTETQLCQWMGVSRNLLREALKSMEVIGMIRSCPGRGTEVCEFSLDFVLNHVMFCANQSNTKAIIELLEIRKRIELGFATQAYQALQPEDIIKIRAIMDGIKEKGKNKILFHHLDREFHMAIFKPLNNSTLNTLLGSIWSVDEHFRVDKKKLFLEETVVKHENIVLALEHRNFEAFQAAMLAHFSSGKYTRQAENFFEI